MCGWFECGQAPTSNWTCTELQGKINRYMNSGVTPYLLVARIVSIIGMGFTAAVAILLFIMPAWWWAIGFTLAFFPFLALIVTVEKYSARHGLIGTAPTKGNAPG